MKSTCGRICAPISGATSGVAIGYSTDTWQMAVSRAVMAFNPNQHATDSYFEAASQNRPVDEVFSGKTRASTEHCEVAVAFDGRPVLADIELARVGFS